MSKSMYFKLEAMLNLRFVEPALSYEKGVTILLQLTRAKDWSDFWLDSGCLVSFCQEKKPLNHIWNSSAKNQV